MPFTFHGYELKEELSVRFKLNFSERVILFNGDNVEIYKLSDISLEYEAVFYKTYAETIGGLYAITTSIMYTKVTSIHY